jgi:hypothetical protein
MYSFAINIARLRNRLGRLQGRAPALHNVAHRSWQIAPARTQQVRPTVISDASLARIDTICDHRDTKVERLRITASSVPQGECRAYELRDVILADHRVYCGGYVSRHGRETSGEATRDWPQPASHVKAATLACSYSGSNYFGTYIKDQLPLYLLAASHGNSVQFAHKPYGHAAGFLQLLGVSSPETIQRVHADSLIVFDDHAQSRDKISRYNQLRKIMHDALQTAPTSMGRQVVYLKRPGGGAVRDVGNEIALCAALKAQGAIVIDPGEMTVADICRSIYGARIVIGIEGSHLAHAVLTLADHGSFIVLQPPDRFSLAYKDFTDAMEMTFASVVGTPTITAGVFDIDISEVLQTIDALDRLSS